MPLHTFKCQRGHITEQIMTFARAEEVGYKIVCPTCVKLYPAKSTVDWAAVQIGTPAVIFKGSGFTPKFHKEGCSSIGGVPVKAGDDPKEVAKKVIHNHGGGKRLFKGLTSAK